ncbi:TonB-dependent receptor [Pedobacter rhodius]|uniref:TonB-dependent receptor n=1 Tax=Pedobacter rhodius TaxID=3004098 RepID=A0ABT4KWP0_9SPHI|nr:TonB-dependent receptor [Pedobacter sp. SJ11]MCZ4223180.1 TonB-dependent receptor [Pedobacter sp. SJ11]
MKTFFKLLLFLATVQTAFAQNNFKVLVKNASDNQSMPGVTIYLKSNPQKITQSDKNGFAILNNLKDGNDTVVFKTVGFSTKQLAILLPDTTIYKISLTADEKALEEVTIIASTRNNERIENAATKVEVLGLEEMNEESMVKPGNVASILGDISGVQIQQSSAVSGNSNIRIQGLDGKYTQMLRDGMPLYEGFSGGFGVLSIPPLDLKQLELIKGSSSTLYGAGAIGGLINFISKKPTFEPDASVVLNTSTLKESNLNAYLAKRWKYIGFTFFAGKTLQQEVDVDKDGLSDVPKLNSTLIHPVLFFYPTENSSVSLGWSGNFEKRTGGDMLAINGKGNTSHPYFETNKLNRNTFTLIADHRFNQVLTGTVKSTFTNFERNITTNTYMFNGTQQNYYAEASLSAFLNKHTLIGGVNLVGDNFKPSSATPVNIGQIKNHIEGIFIQDSWRFLESSKIEAGLRFDHNDYGNFVLPRLAIFHRLSEKFGIRGGFGSGYKSPNPLTPQIKDYDIDKINPLNQNATTERSFGGNLEANYKYSWDDEHNIFINHAFFLTKVNNPFVGFEESNGTLSFFNAGRPIVTQGFDSYIQMKLSSWEIYFGYTFTDAKRKYLNENQFVPLTPKNRAASTLVYEIEIAWRFGIEASYNGKQFRDGEAQTQDYVFMAAMIERKFGPKFSLVLNAENLFDKRQSKYEKIYTGTITNPVYKPLWAPLDGRVINLAIRLLPFARAKAE